MNMNRQFVVATALTAAEARRLQKRVDEAGVSVYRFVKDAVLAALDREAAVAAQGEAHE